MAKDATVDTLLAEDEDDQETASILQGLDPLFNEPIGTTVKAAPPQPGQRQPLAPVLGLTADQEKTAVGGVGAILGPAVQRGIEKLTPVPGARDAAAVERLRQEQQLSRLLQSLEEEELLRRGIDPKSIRPTVTAPDTSGTKWMRNWAGVDREIAGGVPEASAAYQRSKGQGKVTGKITKKFGPEALQPGGLSIQGPRYDPAVRGATEAADILRQGEVAAAQAAAAERLRQARPSALSSIARGARSPFVQGPLAGAFSGMSFYDAYQKWLAGDRSGAVIDALGGVGGLLTMIPTPLTMGAGLALSLGSLPASYINERMRQPDAPATADQTAAQAP